MDTKQRTFSEELSGFLKLLDKAKSDFEWNVEEEARLEALSQDYLHLIELQSSDNCDLAKVAEELRQCRIARREAKDAATLLQPMVDYLNSDKGKLLLSGLQQILGAIRKVEKNMQNRRYTPRVMDPVAYATFGEKEETE